MKFKIDGSEFTIEELLHHISKGRSEHFKKPIIDALIAAERERDELLTEVNRLDTESHRLSDQLGACDRERRDWIKRYQVADAELARRDAAAGEPVAYIDISHLDQFGWAFVFKKPSPMLEGCNYPVYGMPPAVLPPKLSMDIDLELQGEFRVHEAIRRKGFNQALDAALELRAQPQKPVVLPEPHAHLIWIQAGRGPDDYWDDVEVSRSDKDRCCDGSERYAVYSEFEVKAMLDAVGVPYEVKK